MGRAGWPGMRRPPPRLPGHTGPQRQCETAARMSPELTHRRPRVVAELGDAGTVLKTVLANGRARPTPVLDDLGAVERPGLVDADHIAVPTRDDLGKAERGALLDNDVGGEGRS